jgi:Tfp pilus assembly protein PilX
MRMIRNERGIALAICLFVLAALTGLTVAALSMSRSDIVTSRNYRSASQGLAAAEAGIAHAVQIINQVGVIDLKSDVFDVWPSHNAPFASNPQTMSQKASYNYSVSLLSPLAWNASTNRGVITSIGQGSDNSMRTVKAYVIKSDIPNAPPGAIYLATDNNTNATFNGNNFGINGDDMNYTNGLAGTAPAVPGLTTRTETNAQEARNSLNIQQKNNVQGLGFIPGNPATPSISAVNGPTSTQISQLIADLLARPHATVTGSNINGNQAYGTQAAPQITYLSNTSGVTFGNGTVTGYGILIAENSLTLNGNLDFKGLVIVRGSTNVTQVTGSATVWGSIWTTDFNLTVGGHADVQYSSQALAIANQAGGPGALPAPVKIYSWRDTF